MTLVVSENPLTRCSRDGSRDVDVGCLSDSLVINPWVGNDNHSGFLERLGDVVGEVSGGESASNRLSTGETSVLEDGSVSVRSSRDDTDIVGVVDGCEDTGSEDDLFPSLANVDDVDTWVSDNDLVRLVPTFTRQHESAALHVLPP